MIGTNSNGHITSGLDAALIDLLPAAVYVCEAPSGVVVRYNERAAELWGRKPVAGDTQERFCGSHRLYLPDGTPLPHDRCPMADVLRTGEPIRDAEVVIERPDGSLITALVNIRAIRDANGRITGAVNAFQDISTLKRSEVALRQSEQRHRRLLDELPAGAYTCDPSGRITYYNREAVRLWGREPRLNDPTDRFCGSFKLFAVDGTPITHDRCWMALALQDNADYTARQIIIERPCGERRVAMAHASPIHDEHGRVIGAINILVDTTDRVRAEEALRRKEAELTDFVETAPVGMHWVGPDGIIRWANQAELQMLGYSREEYVGRDIADFHADPPVIADILCRLRNREQLRSYAARLRCRDGSIRNVLIDSSVLWDGDRFVHTRCLTRDVTAQKRAEAAQARLAAIVESSDDAILSKTLDGVIQSWNGGAERLFGYTAEEAVGQPIALVIPPDRVDEERGLLDRLRRGERVHHFETVRVAKDGRRLDISLTVSPVRDDGGHVVGASTIARDVTERKRLEDELRVRAEQLAEADRRKDRFLALLAHELRNPLAPIRNGVEVLKLAEADSRRRASVRAMMERQITHLVRLVDDLLDVSRITRGTLELRRSRVRLADVVSSAVETARPLIDAGGHALAVTVPKEPILLDADLTRLAQVISNLLTNSAKYTPPGGRIWLTAEVQNGAAVVVVRDNGIGIPAEALPRIFDMFSRVDRDIERSTGGLGIGLALVRTLVEMHGGTVTAASDGEGKGSTFRMTLPVLASRTDVRKPDNQSERWRGTGHRVLVVDDNLDGAHSMALMLELTGGEVRTAHDGVEAVAVAEEFRPEVILMDVGMPRMNGYEAVRRIRQAPWGRGVRIIAMTGWGQERDRERSRAAGFDGHLVKPVNLPELEKMLKEVPAAKSG
jgi:PAS domain S-box-containing protein